MTAEPDDWSPPTPKVSFVTCRGRWRGRAYVSTVGIWALQSQPQFRGKTEAEALAKAIAHAREAHPEAIVPDEPRVTRL